jgi:hypothetical protein
MERRNNTLLLKIFLIRILPVSCTLFASLASWSQQKNIHAYASMAEKIYLQLDNKVYTTDKTIWFKAIVTDAVEHVPTKLSGVLHVDLIDPNEKPIESKLIKITDGIGDGFFELNQNYPEGLYLVRAYTEWDKNFGSDFFFKEYIQVFASRPKAKASPINNVTLIGGQNNERRIKAVFDPLAIDSLHTKDITLFISLDEKKDTLSIKKNGTGNYLLDYPVPAGCQFVTFQVETKNHVSYSRSIILSKDYLDLQFFPESGEMVHGLPVVLGFKALDSAGKGKIIEGDIVNRKGEIIASFKSNSLGMGSLRLAAVDSTEQYMARIAFTSENGPQKKMYALPPIAPRGNMLSVTKAGQKIRVQASSNYLVNDSLFVRTSCRGVAYFDVKGRLKNGVLEFSLPANSLPEGIIAFTLMKDSLSPVAERLYFNELPESRIRISIAPDKEMYTQRGQTKLLIETKDQEGQPVNASLSVLVLNKEQLGSMQDTRQNILSYLLLSSDLKGAIENPGFYFGTDTSRFDALDALLLTQGWRKYNYTRPTGKIVFQPELTITVSGHVSGGLWGNKQRKGTTLTMMTFGKPPFVDTQTSDSLGRFSFAVNDQYQQSLNILIQTNNKSGVKKDYTITLDKKEPPPVLFDHIKAVEKPDSIVQEYVKKSVERKKAEDAFIAATEGVTLGEVVLKSYAMTPERKAVIDKYGKPGVIIEGDEIREKEAKWSYGLYSVLLFNFPDKIRIERRMDGNLYAVHFNGEVTLVVIDGIPVMPYDYPLISAIPPSEVKSFEVIDYAKNFTSLYCELYPRACLNAPATGNVIAIYTYGKKGIFGANRAVGLTKAAIQTFAAPREFYAPKHEQLTQQDWLKPDLRTLIHWAPKLKTDSSGRASVSFYNADLTGSMQVIVEAISENGEIGYRQFSYEVKKEE